MALEIERERAQIVSPGRASAASRICIRLSPKLCRVVDALSHGACGEISLYCASASQKQHSGLQSRL